MAKAKKFYNLFVRKILKRENKINSFGERVTIAHTIWEKVPEINLGSIKHPNKYIIEFAFEPVESKDRNQFSPFKS